MKRIIALLLLVTVLSGCTGSFMLTKKVYEFHRGMDNKWMDELVFLVVAYLPVYALAMLGDAIIFNTIEFWTDENPISAEAGNRSIEVVEKGDLKAVMAYDNKKEAVKVASYKNKKLDKSFILSKDSNCVMIKDFKGNTVYTSTKDAEGGVSIRNAKGDLIKYFTPEEIKDKREEIAAL